MSEETTTKEPRNDPPKKAGPEPGVLTPQPMRPDVSAISSMAALFQRWAEKCESASKDELTHELAWFLKGAAFAFSLDAQRARSLADPGNLKKPPVGDMGLGQAFEIMVGMLRSMSMAETTPSTSDESTSGNDSDDTGTLTDKNVAV